MLKLNKCKCGCGKNTKNIWARGHSRKGAIFSEEHRKKISEAQKKSSYFKIYNKTEQHKQIVIKTNQTRDTTEIKKKISKTLTGKFRGQNHPNWKGGGKTYKTYNPEFAKLSKLIMKRDNFICQNCFNKPKKIEVHHIDLNSKNDNLSNLITLCCSCHTKLHITDEFREKCSKAQIERRRKETFEH